LPVGLLAPFLKDQVPENFAVFNGQPILKIEAPDLYDVLSHDLKALWEHMGGEIEEHAVITPDLGPEEGQELLYGAVIDKMPDMVLAIKLRNL
jgi:hypothetical protein